MKTDVAKTKDAGDKTAKDAKKGDIKAAQKSAKDTHSGSKDVSKDAKDAAKGTEKK